MEELFGPPAVPVVTAMTIFSVHDFDLPLHKQKTVRNYMNGRVLRHVAKLHFGTVGGKIIIMVEHLLSCVIFWLLPDPYYTL